jgi:FHA domain-containing protein
MEARLYRLRHARLPPAEYYVYLHPDDYGQIEALTPRIVRDIQECLNKRVARLNRRAWWRVLRRPPVIEIPPGGWSIHIRASDPTGLEPGDLGIDSRLSIPPSSEFEDGAPTVRVTRTVVSPTGRTTTVVGETRELPAHGDPGPPTDETPHSGLPAIAYRDDTGAHAFEIRPLAITVGRGGPGHQVDLKLVTSLDVSREHCRISRDPDGRFFVLDLSSWGTFVDGQRVAEAAHGEQVGTEIFDRTVIDLGDRAVALELRTK